MNTQRLNAAVSDLLTAEPREGDAPFSVHVAPAGSAFFALGAELEQDVFSEMFDLTREHVHDHYGMYDAVSDFVLLVDRERLEVAGATRIVRWSDFGFPTFVETQRIPAWGCSMVDAYLHHGWSEAPTRILDVATTALREQYRRRGFCSIGLAQGTYLHSIQLGGAHWICLLEESVMNMMIALGMPWQSMCEMDAQPHEGSAATLPLTVSLDKVGAWVLHQVEIASRGILEQVRNKVSLPTIDLTESGRFAGSPSGLQA